MSKQKQHSTSWRLPCAGLLLGCALLYLGVMSHYFFKGFTGVQSYGIVLHAGHGQISSNSNIGSSDKSAAVESAAKAAVAKAAQQPVVIGLTPSGQWPFWQAAKGGALLADLGPRRSNMQGDKMDANNPDWIESNCTYMDVPIDCTFTLNTSRHATADGMYFHTPGYKSVGSVPKRLHPKQIRFAVSAESAGYYPWINNPEYMCQFEAEATYRSCSNVLNSMHHETQHDFVTGQNMVHAPPLPFEEKENAVAYINSNCNSPSGRAQIINQWMTLPNAKVPIHAYGACNNNMQMPTGGSRTEMKRKVFRTHKFCISMENSISYDYITEKVWDGLSAGCIPIYMGSPNIFQFMPESHAVIVYGKDGNVSSVEELDALVHRIMNDKAEYERMLAWKHKPISELSPTYQHYLTMIQGTNECRMCIHIIKKRIANGFKRDVSCMWNQTWLQEAGLPFTNYTCPES